MIKKISLAEANTVLDKYGVTIPMWCTCQVRVPGYEVMVCDYRGLSGYLVAFAVEVWDIKAQTQVERFNIMR